MGFFDRLATGWNIALNSFKVLRANKQLILFPILSGASLVLIMGSFVGSIFAFTGTDTESIDLSPAATYLLIFLYYLINYFIVVFFNTALIHCTHLYFKGEDVTIQKGLKFAVTRLWAIFQWAVFAATIGTILKAIQENVGWLGKLITAAIGIVWSVATFFVVPVIAYENLGPIDAFKRSSQIMRDKWGERIGAGFSFGIIQLLAMFLVCVPLFIAGAAYSGLAGMLLALMGAFLIFAVMSAAQTIFISAVYHNINGDTTEHFNQQLIDKLFIEK